MNTAKKEVRSLLKRLPNDCTFEDIQYHLHVIEKINNGFERARKEASISQEEVKKRLFNKIIKLKIFEGSGLKPGVILDNNVSLLDKLEKGINSGPVVEVNTDYWSKKKENLRRKFRNVSK